LKTGFKIMTPYRISIVGTGYVGLCTAVGFASKGYNVLTSTHDPKKASLINKGTPPFHEPHLEEMLQKAVKNGYLRCMLDHEEAILNTDITFIAVGTPSKPNGSIDLRYIEGSACEIGGALKKKETSHLVVVKSTVVPGTTKNVVKPAIEKHSGKRCSIDFGLCMNPEFLREGSALQDTLHPDRIIIGEYDKKSGDVLEALYREFYEGDMPPLIRTNLPTAEFIKYANNAFLAMKVSFINSVANLCQKTPEADVKAVAQAIGLDKRIGSLFLNAGLGWGGSCWPKDLNALLSYSKDLDIDLPLVDATLKVNHNQPHIALSLARSLIGELKGKRIAVLGLSFKPNTDDVREAVSIKIINKLLNEGAEVVTHDPQAIDNAKAVLGNRVQYERNVRNCLKDADCCIIVTEWDEYRALRPQDFRSYMKNPAIVDGRRIYDPKAFKSVKFAAVGLGTTDS